MQPKMPQICEVGVRLEVWPFIKRCRRGAGYVATNNGLGDRLTVCATHAQEANDHGWNITKV
jgi:hypothetical protein